MRLILLLLIAISQSATLAATFGLEMVLQDKIFKADKIEFNFEKWVNANGVVSTPPATWVLLLKMRSSGSEYCLFYRSEFEDKKGVLRFNESPACEESYDRPQYSADFINELTLKFNKSESAFEMGLAFSKSEDAKNYKFFFPSYKGEREALKALSDSAPSGAFSYLSLSPSSEPKFELIGKFGDNYRDSSATICHKVNAKCEDEIPNHCSQCAFGAYEVVDHLCPQGGSKFCGINHCGEQGQPACPRGELAAGRSLSQGEVLDWCSKDSPAGFCQNGLTPTCDGNKILICL